MYFEFLRQMKLPIRNSGQIFAILIFVISALVSSSFVKSSASCMQKAQGVTGSTWVDSVFNSLSQEERIAQLMIIRSYSDQAPSYYKDITDLISEYNIGGITFFKGSPVSQAQICKYWQRIAKTPLLICMDGEWGVGMRLDSVMDFPYQMTLGAIRNDSLIYLMAKAIGKQFKRIGINVNFAPVVDVNNNPLNPVINFRSFGENKYNVANKGIAYMKGLQDEGILATAKHFPGHGDTDSDSHYTLPIIKHSSEYIDTLELIPFKKLIEKGVDAIMIAHLYLPAFDTAVNTPSTLSKSIVSDLLREKLGFNGLIITDALDMKGVTEFIKPGEIELKALLAGNDILLLPEDVPKAVKKIKKAISKGLISQEVIDEKCKKILKYKYKAGLSDYKDINIKGLSKDLNEIDNIVLNKILYENAITVVRNHNDILPLKRLDTLKVASVSVGVDQPDTFTKTLQKYSSIDNFFLPQNPEFTEIKTLIKTLEKYNLVIVSIKNTNNSPRLNYGISQRSIDFISLLKNNKKIILDIFANPYSLARIRDYKNIESIILSYQDNPVSHDVSAQIIMGGIAAKGRLPVSASNDFPAFTGIDTKKIRFGYCMPEEVNIPSEYLNKIDSIASTGIEIKAYPGCRILFAKDGQIFYDKSFGFHTYDSLIKVTDNDIYDLASLTKIAATTLAIMKLYDEDKVDIDQKMSYYLPSLAESNKNNLIIREVMAHQAKLKAWIPFYLEIIDAAEMKDSIFSNKQSSEYPLRVARDLYIHKNYRDTIFARILESPLNRKNNYKYSDLGFYYLMEIVEKVSGQSLDEYLLKNFYLPLNLESMRFQPYKQFDLSRIVPSEVDTAFRHQIIHGDVNDPGAAMLGGIGGHAGLFSDAKDMAIIMQMLLQGGEYGGIKFIDKETVDQFTKQQFPLNDNRRGIGFDKPFDEWEENGPACEGASDKSFGHSGYTGTYAWADPENQLVYVFLSNRTYPDNTNTKLAKLNIRTKVHQIIYDAFQAGGK